MALTLKSTAFEDNSNIPKQYTCDGKDISPPLSWEDPPAGTQSFAVIMDDPDAPPGTWVHWILYEIPASQNQLPENLEKSESLSDGSKHGLVWGVHEFSRVGYYGPCPPPGKPHRYIFRIYALKEKLNLPPKAAKPQLMKAMEGKILGEASLTGLFGR